MSFVVKYTIDRIIDIHECKSAIRQPFRPGPWSARSRQRELVRFFRQRNRVFGALGQPIIFWLLFGAGLGSASRNDSLDYAHFFPGTLVMILLFTAIFATISIIEDRREGFLAGRARGARSRAGRWCSAKCSAARRSPCCKASCSCCSAGSPASSAGSTVIVHDAAWRLIAAIAADVRHLRSRSPPSAS